METGKEIAWALKLRSEQYRAELEKLPGWTQDAARKAADGWLRGEQKALAGRAAGLKAGAEDVGKAWAETGKKISTLVGGPFAKIGEVVFELAPKAGAAAGAFAAVGVAAAGAIAAAAGVAAIAYGLHAVADAGLEAEDRLTKAGKAALIPEEARASLELYREESEALRTEWDVLTATIGGKAASAFRGTTALVSAAKARAEDFAVQSGAAKTRTEAWSDALGKLRVILAATTGLMSEAVIALVKYGDEAAASAEKHVSASKIALDMAQSEADAEDQLRRDAAKRAEALLKKQHDDAVAAYKQHAAERQRIEQRYQDFLADVRKKAVEREASRQADVLDVLVDKLDKQLAIYQEAADRRTEIETAQQQAAAEVRAAAIEETIAELDRLESVYTDAAESAKDAWTDMASSSIDILTTVSGAVTAAAENGSKAQKRAARDFAIFVKAATLANVVAQGIQQVAVAAASAPPPFNIPIAAAAALQAAARTASVIATPIPTAFGGRSRGNQEELVRVHPNEPILNSRATEGLMRLLNERLSPLSTLPGALAGAGAGAPAPIYLDRRKVGRVLSGRVGGAPPAGYSPRRR